MLSPIITPSQTAVMFAVGSASRIGATIGTTTTAISMKSRKKPSTKITAMTMTNWVQNPPGSPCRKWRTISSPPKARKAAVSTAAPSRMMNTRLVVLAVSSITPCSVCSMFITRMPDQTSDASSAAVAASARYSPVWSSSGPSALMFRDQFSPIT